MFVKKTCCRWVVAAAVAWGAATVAVAQVGGAAAPATPVSPLAPAPVVPGAAVPAPAMPSTPTLQGPQRPSQPGEKPAAEGADSKAKDFPRGGVELPALQSTEFERFVREATGRSLPLFGYNLFSAGGFPALQNVPVSADYVIGPGDEVNLKVWGAVDADLRLPVDRNGQISIPRVGSMNVAGLRASQLEGALRAQIGRVYNNFQLSAALGQLRSIQIFVVGQARQPGTYTVSSLSTLVSALFDVGGPSATGSMRNIQLRRDGRIVSTLDMYRFISEGDKSADAKLLPGDVIVIPPAGPRVALTGATDSPAIYELAGAEEPLGKLLSYAGRTNVLTTPQKVHIERVDATRAKAPRIVEDRALDAKGLQSTVRDGDVITLFRISPEFGNAVTLRGNVAAPLRYSWRPGMKVSDLIPERDALIVPDYYVRRNMLVQFESGRRVSDTRIQAEVKNLVEEINWDYAVVERLDPREIRSQLIPFNLAKAVINKDPANDLPLQPGDVVTVFGVNDLPIPVHKRSQYVRISGEINVPGVYQILPGETLDRLVVRAGGFSTNAYPYGMVFTRESTRQQQQRNLDQAIRRMQAEIASQASRAIQSVSTPEDNRLYVENYTRRDIVAKLQSLRASGRIALELSPESPAVPPVALEDGDEISVPPMPSFVGVFGAVTAETSFLHRYNFSVRDYLDRAGPTRDADFDSVSIVRADGTVESESSGGRGPFTWFGSSVLDRRVNPGDTVFVPEKFDKRSPYTRFIEGVKDWTTIFYQFGLGIAAIKVLRD
ncbi:polysaccharide biosynthesis/export family protein [Ramlibacter albus]|uniref:SLBB domain-containing protein n=1 Tax=Ramlibacter albus TaxID=2079448 RepID=A0A923S306_9BURK|nr:polysaccharide biosynthesis/export family protein [Ramlibacter albus]MBC5765338.1 SLBB domain-containing protein [Ramlibacter albus]